MRLRNFLTMRAVLRGGVADSESIPSALMKEMYVAGNLKGALIQALRVGRLRQSSQETNS
jgi:hypothetical protein